MQQQQQDPSRWNEMKSALSKNWNKITADEWEKTHGDEESMSSILQERYGLSEDVAQNKLSGVLGKYRGEEHENDLGNNTEKFTPKGNRFSRDQAQTQDDGQDQDDDIKQNFGKNQSGSNAAQAPKSSFQNQNIGKNQNSQNVGQNSGYNQPQSPKPGSQNQNQNKTQNDSSSKNHK